MNAQPHEPWDRMESFANQKLSNNFAATVVRHAQQQRYAARRRKTMLVVYGICMLGAWGTSYWHQSRETLQNAEQWQYLYVENEIMRTSI
ncbi:MAG: hypothetical protein ACOY3I_03715 [Verrucomicrobiota bacterium]